MSTKPNPKPVGKTEICDLDCFNCKYPDCINDEFDYRDIVESRQMERDFLFPKSKTQEKNAEYSKKYRSKNIDKLTSYEREYYRVHREEKLAKGRERWAERKLAYNASHRAWYDKVKDERNAKWREQYPEKKDEINARRRARYKANSKEFAAKHNKYYHEHKDEINARRRAKRLEKRMAATKVADTKDQEGAFTHGHEPEAGGKS